MEIRTRTLLTLISSNCRLDFSLAYRSLPIFSFYSNSAHNWFPLHTHPQNKQGFNCKQAVTILGNSGILQHHRWNSDLQLRPTNPLASWSQPTSSSLGAGRSWVTHWCSNPPMWQQLLGAREPSFRACLSTESMKTQSTFLGSRVRGQSGEPPVYHWNSTCTISQPPAKTECFNLSVVQSVPAV